MLKCLLPKMGVAPVVFDVGFNKGDYSKTVLDIVPNAKVFGFEPNPLIAEMIRQDSDNLELINCGLSDEVGHADLHDAPSSHGTTIGSLHKEHVANWCLASHGIGILPPVN
ncbi:2-O-methyltransferase NoeI [Stieleria bergensis]|uniref:2-O-methyltransferase NoeI n=2 Tax=Stieleria bergensis TaxID=2528025 RepID=A0A517SXM0_9BACT|nr:2-O-methyltransferase NoeI [Planctomycetes bacterium SV_7m_r]